MVLNNRLGVPGKADYFADKQAAEELYTVSDWQYEVANGDTKLGYDEWLEHRIEANQ
jgi:hypothetical protein